MPEKLVKETGKLRIRYTPFLHEIPSNGTLTRALDPEDSAHVLHRDEPKPRCRRPGLLMTHSREKDARHVARGDEAELPRDLAELRPATSLPHERTDQRLPGDAPGIVEKLRQAEAPARKGAVIEDFFCPICMSARSLGACLMRARIGLVSVGTGRVGPGPSRIWPGSRRARPGAVGALPGMGETRRTLVRALPAHLFGGSARKDKCHEKFIRSGGFDELRAICRTARAVRMGAQGKPAESGSDGGNSQLAQQGLAGSSRLRSEKNRACIEQFRFHLYSNVSVPRGKKKIK